jgi:hypothetical protein
MIVDFTEAVDSLVDGFFIFTKFNEQITNFQLPILFLLYLYLFRLGTFSLWNRNFQNA